MDSERPERRRCLLAARDRVAMQNLNVTGSRRAKHEEGLYALYLDNIPRYLDSAEGFARGPPCQNLTDVALVTMKTCP